MRATVTFLTRDAAQGTARRTQQVEGDALLIGRETGAAVYLPDPRVLMRQAVIESTALGYGLRALGWAPLATGGAAVERTMLVPGTSAMIGPYRLSVEPPQAGFDLALTLELVQPPEPGGAAAAERLLASLTPSPFDIRRASWVSALLVLLLAATLPLVGWLRPAEGVSNPAANATMGSSGRLFQAAVSGFWSVGTMSNAHRSFGMQCNSCHVSAFAPVSTPTCLSCHQTVTQHADPHVFPAVDLGSRDCSECHLEHKGERQAIRSDQAFCVGCHADIHATAPRSRLLDVGDFATSHPEFRVQVVADPSNATLSRISLDSPTPPVSRDNLIFSHAVHLDPDGILSGDGSKTRLDCASCHVPDAAGRRMKPIVMETHCASCHGLSFEPRHPEWQLTHGKPERVLDEIQSHYSQMALAGEVPGIAANSLLMRPGSSGPREAAAASWVRARTIEALATTFGKSACGLCHKVDPPPGDDPLAWRIEPVMVPQTYLPKARFSHAEHATQPCASCHAAADAKEDAPVMMPSIAQCRNCHGDEHATRTEVATSCTTCHAFHAPVPTTVPLIMDALRRAAR